MKKIVILLLVGIWSVINSGDQLAKKIIAAAPDTSEVKKKRQSLLTSDAAVNFVKNSFEQTGKGSIQIIRRKDKMEEAEGEQLARFEIENKESTIFLGRFPMVSHYNYQHTQSSLPDHVENDPQVQLPRTLIGLMEAVEKQHPTEIFNEAHEDVWTGVTYYRLEKSTQEAYNRRNLNRMFSVFCLVAGAVGAGYVITQKISNYLTYLTLASFSFILGIVTWNAGKKQLEEAQQKLNNFNQAFGQSAISSNSEAFVTFIHTSMLDDEKKPILQKGLDNFLLHDEGARKHVMRILANFIEPQEEIQKKQEEDPYTTYEQTRGFDTTKKNKEKED